MQDKSKIFQYRIAHAVWVNDLRNEALANYDWPCVILDQTAIDDIKANIQLQSESGFNSLAIFGLLTASYWLPDIALTVDAERKNKVTQILGFAKEQGITIYYGLGVYSWGFDKIIEYDCNVRGTNPKVMCGSSAASLQWMHKVVDYLMDEYDFAGFHLEAADLGRCNCSKCQAMSNSQYFCEINTKIAEYIYKRSPNCMLLVSLCGYLSPGTVISHSDWVYYQKMSKQIDCLIDPGHFGTFIPLSQRQEFIRSLDCAFGNGGGVWLYPSQFLNRLSYFIPYIKRTGTYIENLYADGAKAIEYNIGPIINPAIEVNIVFGGIKLNSVTRSNREILLEVIEKLYRPKTTAACHGLANLFEQAEDAFFNSMDEMYPADKTPLGEIHLTYLFGTEAKQAIYLSDVPIPSEHQWYLTRKMTPIGRLRYIKNLQDLLIHLEQLESDIDEKERLERIKLCLNNVISQVLQ